MSNIRLIYHFTHIDNLSHILKNGMLLADSLVQEARILRAEIGDRDIKERRRSMKVTRGSGGSPSDYVPFYFAPRSPMLYKINKGGVAQYQGGQESLVYLVSSVDRVIASELRWVFTDGNCASDITDYFDDAAKLDDLVDWPLMKAQYWNDTADDPDRMRRRMAEFLVYQRFPLDILIGVGVMTDAMGKAVSKILHDGMKQIHVRVRPDWYY